MPRTLADLAGTNLNTFRLGKPPTRATFDASGLTAPRALTVQDASGTLALVADVAAAQAYAIQRANHTGTQLAATISDFAAAALAATASAYDPAGLAAAVQALAVLLAGSQTVTGVKTFSAGLATTYCDAADVAGVHIGNNTHQDVALFGAGGGQGVTFYGQLNGTAIDLTGAAGLTTRQAATQDALRLQGRPSGTGGHVLTVTTASALAASGTLYLPPVAGATVLATVSTPAAGHIPFSAGTNYAATLSTDLNFDVGTQTLRVGTISGSINTVLLATAGNGGAGTARVRLGTNVREWEIKAGASPYAFSIDYVGTDAPLANVLSMTKAGAATFSSTTDASAIGTAAIVGLGGASFAKKVYVGGPTTSAGASLQMTSATPGFGFDETDAAADEKVWDMFVSSGQMIWRMGDDARSVFNAWMTVDRAAGSPNYVQLHSTVDATTTADGAVRLSGGLSVADGKQIVQGSTSFHYWGSSGVDGSWRFGRSGNDFVIQRRESAAWVTKQTIAA